MKNIVITGATGGVGSMLAKGLAKNGHRICCLGRNELLLNELVQFIKNEGGSASYKIADMMDGETVSMVGNQLINELSCIDVWINNVGVNNHNAIGPTSELKPENWWTEVSLNLYTAFVGTRTGINLITDKNYGYIR